MSADLLAAFGEPNNTAQQQQHQQQQQQGQSPQQPSRENDRASASRLFDSDTDTRGAWGSFLSTSREARIASRSNSEQGSRSQTPVPDLKSAQIASTASSTDLWREEGGTDVLFDASTEDITNDDDTDDWGEFETANPPVVGTDSGNAVDLLDWDAGNDTALNVPSSGIESTTVKFHQQALVDLFPPNAKAHGKVVTEVAAPDMKSWNNDWTNFEDSVSGNVVSSKSEQPDDDDWGDFTDATWVKNATNTTTTPLESSKLGASLDEATKPDTKQPISTHTLVTSTMSNGFQLRPMNIPPPSILLPLFPPLLEQYYQKGVKSKQLGSQDAKLASSLESDLKVMARILVGRTHRWKRDTVLSQSTKIGPARSGKVGGMKLSSLNKSESVKEEKEAVEVLEAWRKRSSYLNSFILSAGGRAVPVFSDNVQLKTGTVEEDGAFKASHACGLCGLKRDERIPKIDGIVHDNFGEWWIELWGHTDCRNFWEANCGRLNQR
ncbi:hypothetical protein EMCG_00941 [[Emmonsia] crescens]|uniref:Uncharacterized protein n=1 Tax=[Emmonsia] crescens TaxID=73230 RepID=A0A0G2HNM5_9EURO|nr:hypothetical protein EMCG_00941 [Emmonsia crescens UAMH 3008]